MKKNLVALSITALLMTACGGGGGGDSLPSSTTLSTNTGQDPTTQSGTLSVLVADNLTEQYDEVWVSIKSIDADDQNANLVRLFEDTDGRVLNMMELPNVGRVLNTLDVPVATYTTFRLELDSQIALVDSSGSMTLARINEFEDSAEIDVPGAVAVASDDAVSVTFDFDIEQFSYDSSTGIVVPAILVIDEESLREIDAKIEGRVTAVSDSTHFEVQLPGNNTPVLIQLHENAVVTDKLTVHTEDDTSLLGIGDDVEVYGKFDTSDLSMDALSVWKGSAAQELGVDNDRSEIEGFVQSLDGSELELNIIESDFSPSTNTVTVANVSNAYFSRGRLDLLGTGQRVEVKGYWDGQVFVADFIEIEGANAPFIDDSGIENAYAEVRGQVVAFHQDQIQLRVQELEHFGGPLAEEMTVDLGRAWFKHGDLACLTDGVNIEAKGPVRDGVMEANVVEFEDDCSVSSSIGSPRHDSNDSSETNDDEFGSEDRDDSVESDDPGSDIDAEDENDLDGDDGSDSAALDEDDSGIDEDGGIDNDDFAGSSDGDSDNDDGHSGLSDGDGSDDRTGSSNDDLSGSSDNDDSRSDNDDLSGSSDNVDSRADNDDLSGSSDKDDSRTDNDDRSASSNDDGSGADNDDRSGSSNDDSRADNDDRSGSSNDNNRADNDDRSDSPDRDSEV